jgi:hypothetical protein
MEHKQKKILNVKKLEVESSALHWAMFCWWAPLFGVWQVVTDVPS